MIFKENWKLQQLNIIQWELRRPVALCKKITFFVPKEVHLVITTKNLINLDDIFIKDVLYALQIDINQVLQMKPSQTAITSYNKICKNWQIGIKEKVKFDGYVIVSPSLDKLKKNPEARRTLWKQILKLEKSQFN